MRRRATTASRAVALALLAGCNNPFDPKADVELAAVNPVEVRVFAAELSNPQLPIGNWAINLIFIDKNRVGVSLTSVDVVYSDYNGNEVTGYRTTGGRHFKIATRIDPVTNNDQFQFGEGLQSEVQIFLVDRTVVAELQSPAYPSNHYMFADVTLRGEDDNGHDMKFTARLTIKYFTN